MLSLSAVFRTTPAAQIGPGLVVGTTVGIAPGKANKCDSSHCIQHIPIYICKVFTIVFCCGSDVPLLLLKAAQATGAFAGVNYVERTNTRGEC